MQREEPPAMGTELERIAAKARDEPTLRFTSLANHITNERVWKNLGQIRTDSAPGVDGQTVTEAKESFGVWIEPMLQSVHRQGYQAPNIRRVYIPKPGKHEKRPLGVPCVADRALQRSAPQVLSAMVRGHYAYYGIVGNIRALQRVHRAVERYWRKMLSSRSWKGEVGWKHSTESRRGFHCYDLSCISRTGSYKLSRRCAVPSDERSAGKLHATFCGSRGWVTASGDPVRGGAAMVTLNGHAAGKRWIRPRGYLRPRPDLSYSEAG